MSELSRLSKKRKRIEAKETVLEILTDLYDPPDYGWSVEGRNTFKVMHPIEDWNFGVYIKTSLTIRGLRFEDSMEAAGILDPNGDHGFLLTVRADTPLEAETSNTMRPDSIANLRSHIGELALEGLNSARERLDGISDLISDVEDTAEDLIEDA